MVDLSTSLAGIPLTSCIYNASGPRSGTSEALNRVAKSKAGAVLSKSATLASQKGNPQPRTYHDGDKASFNSEGLPNNGIDYYIAKETIDAAMEGTQGQKPYIVSLSGKTLVDNLQMLDKIANSDTKDRISAIELNLACPNVIGKPIIAYDTQQLDEILKTVAKKTTKLPPLGVKLPPFLDFSHFQAVAKILNQHKQLVKYIASINTVGNALCIDTETEAPYISSNNGFAGLSGPVVKYTALANVRKLRELLDDDIDVVGVGGVTSGEDVFQLLLCGATAVQIGTCHWKEGPVCFDRIHRELEELMAAKGYASIQDVRGKLKSWSRENRPKAALAAQESNVGGSPGATSTELQFYKMLSAMLVVIAAILYADRFHIKLLPSEGQY